MLTRGWYQDPDEPELARWCDGERMTRHTLVIADQPQGRTPAPPVDDSLSWSPEDIPYEDVSPRQHLSADLDRGRDLDLAFDLGRTPDLDLDLDEDLEDVEELRRGTLADLAPDEADDDLDDEDHGYEPRHRVREDELTATFWDASRIEIRGPRKRLSDAALPLVGVAIVVLAVLSILVRGGDDGGDQLEAVNDTRTSTSTTVDLRPAVSLPTVSTVTSTTLAPGATSSSTTSTTKKPAPAKPPAASTPTTPPTAAPTTTPATTSTTSPAVTAGDSCSPQGASGRTAHGDPVSCAPACDAGPDDLVWRSLDC